MPPHGGCGASTICIRIDLYASMTSVIVYTDIPMKRPLRNIRPFGPLFQTNSEDKGYGGARMYHSTSPDRLDNILSDGLQTSFTGDSQLTPEIEAVLEKHRPEDNYPSRTTAIFTFSDIGMAKANSGDAVVSFKTSDAPCAGWGVHQAGELMGIANIIRNSEEGDYDVDQDSLERSAKNFWVRDVAGPITSEQDFQDAQDRIQLNLSEVYFPCSIPPDILRVE